MGPCARCQAQAAGDDAAQAAGDDTKAVCDREWLESFARFKETLALFTGSLGCSGQKCAERGGVYCEVGARDQRVEMSKGTPTRPQTPPVARGARD